MRATTRRSLDPGTEPRAPECEQAGIKRAPTARGSERADVERSGAEPAGVERTGVVRAPTVAGFSLTTDERVEFAVHERADLEPGTTVSGPAIIFEPTATTYVDSGFAVTPTESAALSIRRSPREPTR